MARDLYGEMLSRALNRGAPPGHFPAYINPGEAAQLRAQGGGVPLGGGQYVVNGLPSYQQPSAADIQGAIDMAIGLGVDPGSPEYAAVEAPDFTVPVPAPSFVPDRWSFNARTLHPVGLAPGIDPITGAGTTRSSGPGTLPMPEAVEMDRERAAWPPGEATAPPPRAVEPTGPPPEERGNIAYEQERAPTGFTPLLPLRARTEAKPIQLRAESAQRTAQEANDKQQIIQDAAVAKVKASYGYNENTPEGYAAVMAAIQANRLPNSGSEMQALNFEVIINDARLTPEEMASRLSANISEGGIGKYAPAAGAARRAVDRGYGDDPNLKPILRNLTRLTPEGEYAVMGGGVSMPRELMSFIPALAGSAATAILPPAIGGLAALGMWGAGGPGLTRWAEAKYGPWDNPLANFLLMRRGPGERVLPEIEDTQRLRRQPDFSQPYGGAPDVPIAEPPFAPPQSVTDEEDVVEEVVVGDGERTLDPISQAIQDRLRRNRELGEEQRRLAQALIPRQFA